MANVPQPPYDPTRPVTIDIPGVQDIIRIPAMESSALKRERVERIKTSNSALPDDLRWLVKVVNTLDNAQDLLYTLLFLGKKLAPKLAARFVPGLGWLLLGNDILNCLTGLFGMALTGRPPKKAVASALGLLVGARKRRLERARGFLAYDNWFAFGVQGLQTTQNLTGYGLALGTVMGAATDGVWSLARVAQGNSVIFRGPPPSDIASKAARYLATRGTTHNVLGSLSADEKALLLLADYAATQELMRNRSQDTFDDRAHVLYNTMQPQSVTWSPTSAAALRAAGAPADLVSGPVPGRTGTRHTIGLQVNEHGETDLQQQALYRETWLSPDTARFMQASHTTAGLNVWDWLDPQDKPTTPEYSPFEKAVFAMIEYRIYPPAWPNRNEIRRQAREGTLPQLIAALLADGRFARAIDLSLTIAAQRGRRSPGQFDLRMGIFRVYGKVALELPGGALVFRTWNARARAWDPIL